MGHRHLPGCGLLRLAAKVHPQTAGRVPRLVVWMSDLKGWKERGGRGYKGKRCGGKRGIEGNIIRGKEGMECRELKGNIVK